MNFEISTAFVLFVISVGAESTVSELVFMKISYSEKLLDGYFEQIANITSGQECVELCNCRDHQCKSVGIDTSSMDCYLYNGRVYAGLPGTVNTDMVYYWQLEAECPIHLGYKEDRNSKICSKYNKTKATWAQALDQCETENGILMLVDTPEKTIVLNEYAVHTAYETKMLLGATDEAEEDVWNWFNGIPIVRSAFMSGRPNNYDGIQHCLVYKYTPPYSGLDDTGCADDTYKSGFICEVPTRMAFNT